jgi:hypothetical protein
MTLSEEIKRITNQLWDEELREDGGESTDERSAYHVGLVKMRQSMLDLVRINRLDAAPELLAVAQMVLELADTQCIFLEPDEEAQIKQALARARAEEVRE